MTHHLIAARAYHQENHTGKVFERGKGKISILQPDMGDPDWVTEKWFDEYQNILPPGTVITLADGRKYSVPE